MSCKVMYTCDHCGKEVSPYINRQWKAGFLTVGSKIDDIHACSKEHLSLALAKVFDIPLDTSTLRLVTEKNDALNAARVAIVDRDNMRARVAELEPRIPANEVTNAERAQYDQTIELQQKRITDLEKRIASTPAPPTVDGKTPGQVDYEAYSAARLGPDDHGSRWDHLDERTKQWNEAGAKAVLRAFGNQPGQTPPTSAVEVLRRARDFIGQCLEFTVIDGDVEFVTVAKKSVMLAISEELAKCGPAEPTVDDYVKAVAEAGTLESRRVKPASDHAHEIGSCSFCDKPPGTASITDPSKPTKPEES